MAALGEIESASSSTTLRPSQEEYTPLEQAVRFELSDSIGTVFSDVRLSSLLREQLDELLLLVAERGVVIFENQADFSTSTKDEIISYWDPGYVSAIAEGDNQYLDAPSQAQDQWHTDASYETTPPSFSLLNIEGEQEKLGETAWVSQYGTYDELSKPLQRLVSELTAVHTSGQHTASHPAVRTHPVTGWRTLNVTPEDVVRLPEINKKESDKILELLDYQIQSAAEHTVRRKWKVGDVALWDNRCTAYRHISGTSAIQENSTKSYFSREKPYFDPASESRVERISRIEKEAAHERERIEQVKRRYNNTPLRRIIARQISREVFEAFVPEKRDKPSPVDSVISEEDSANAVGSLTLEAPRKRTEQWTFDMNGDVEVLKKRNGPVKRGNTPLSRILERQLSAGAGIWAVARG